MKPQKSTLSEMYTKSTAAQFVVIYLNKKIFLCNELFNLLASCLAPFSNKIIVSDSGTFFSFVQIGKK